MEVCDAHRIRLQNMFSPSHGQSCRTSLPQSPELSNDYFDLLGPGDPQNEPFCLLKHFNVEELVATTFLPVSDGFANVQETKVNCARHWCPFGIDPQLEPHRAL